MPTDKLIGGNRVSAADPMPVTLYDGDGDEVSASLPPLGQATAAASLPVVEASDGPSVPGRNIVAVTKDNSADDPNGPFRGLIMDAVGAVKLHTAAGSDVTLPSGLLAAGVIHPIRFTRVWVTGTGTQNIFGVT